MNKKDLEIMKSKDLEIKMWAGFYNKAMNGWQRTLNYLRIIVILIISLELGFLLSVIIKNLRAIF